MARQDALRSLASEDVERAVITRHWPLDHWIFFDVFCMFHMFNKLWCRSPPFSTVLHFGFCELGVSNKGYLQTWWFDDDFPHHNGHMLGVNTTSSDKSVSCLYFISIINILLHRYYEPQNNPIYIYTSIYIYWWLFDDIPILIMVSPWSPPRVFGLCNFFTWGHPAIWGSTPDEILQRHFGAARHRQRYVNFTLFWRGMEAEKTAGKTMLPVAWRDILRLETHIFDRRNGALRLL